MTTAATAQPTIDELQLLMARGWPGLRQERLGDWVLRFGAGATGRANSVLVVGDAGMPVPAAVAEVESRYRAAGLAPQFQIAHPLTGPASTDLDIALTARGYRIRTPTYALTADLRDPTNTAAKIRDPQPTTSAYRLEITDEPDAILRNSGDPGRIAEMTAAPAGYLAIRDAAGTIIGRCRVSAIGGWAGISDLQIDTAHRRRGLARLAMAELLTHARRRDCDMAYLQVVQDNTVALALYESTGWRRHHRYHYRKLD